MSATILYTWIGESDRKAAKGENRKGQGAVADALSSTLAKDAKVGRVVLLDDKKDEGYCAWLKKQLQKEDGSSIAIERQYLPPSTGGVIDYNWIYQEMWKVVAQTKGEHTCIYLVGAGTSAMATCTLLVSRLQGCRGTVWQVDHKHQDGVRELQLPFDLIVAPDPAAQPDGALTSDNSSLICKDPVMQKLWHKARWAAGSEYPILILGPTGAGKEVLAQHIHETSGRGGKFIAINCGALPETLIESALFGHAKGAFTGAQQAKAGAFEDATGGSIFLDEIGDLPLQQQVKILRVLQERKIVRVGETQERPINCHIIAATHRDLDAMIRQDRFRADLYYRLATLVFRIPPLADRPADLDALIRENWKKIVDSNPGFPGKELTEDAYAALKQHHWPGNVRELKQALVRLAFWADGARIDGAAVRKEIANHEQALRSAAENSAEKASAIPPDFDLKQHQRDESQEWARLAFRQANGKKSEAARLLGISSTHLGRLLADKTRQE